MSTNTRIADLQIPSRFEIRAISSAKLHLLSLFDALILPLESNETMGTQIMWDPRFKDSETPICLLHLTCCLCF